MDASFGSANLMKADKSEPPNALQEVRLNRYFSLSGRLLASFISFLIEPAGGIFIAYVRAVLSRYVRRTQSLEVRNGVFRMSLYAFESEHRIVSAYCDKGVWKLGSIDTETSRFESIDVPFTEIYSVQAAQGRAFFCGASPESAVSVIALDLTTGRFEVLQRSSSIQIDRAYLSIPRALEYPTENSLTSYAFFYPPSNSDFQAPENERPPLIVISHGGPTHASAAALKLTIQYWTSRGLGVLDVNYGGSTGFGTEYRRRLNGQWGVVDGDDCVNAARYLVEKGEADGKRLIIRGGSAGGYTTLAALTFRDVFKAGASYYGISDIEMLEQDCHKFESRYNDS